ncbi:MAG TPA: 50S ribosomal protein L9 [Chthoniobacteraceae bacterium]|jgi:large subunit ribosomal protein L9|nr:50S ribosomal protein L9 [Chthoniobacteraceae bacterium]
MANTQVILTEPIAGLGAEADVVKVKPGYARNFLIPRGKAFEVTPASLKQINSLKAKRAEREGRELNEAEELARRINKLKLTLTLETGETGKAFGSITAKDIADKLKGELGGSAEIERHRIVLERPIKDTGAHEIEIKLHHDVVARLNLNVKSSKAEGAEEGAAPAAEGEHAAGEQGFRSKAKARHSK